MLASRPLHVLTALPIFHIGGLLAQKSRSICRRGASQHRERYRCWPEGGALAPPLAKAICLTARAKSFLLFFIFFIIWKQSGALPNVFAKSNICNYDLKTVGSATECFRQKQFLKRCMVLKQSGALPNVFAKSNFEIMYGLKTVGSATDCFRHEQFLKICMVLKQSGAPPNVFAKSNFEIMYGLKTVGSATDCFRQKQFLKTCMVLKQSGALPNAFAKSKFWA